MSKLTNFKKPKIRYAKNGTINIAYQVFGEGDTDLVYIPSWISNIDLMWSCPELVTFFQELGKTTRIILFDKRGTGLSDRFIGCSTIEERMEDIMVVMNAVNSQKAILFGHAEGASLSALFSAIYPNKVIALITFGFFAKRLYSKDYPWAPTVEERQKLYTKIKHHWGRGKMCLEKLIPSKANDEDFMDWLASYLRSGASPTEALKHTKMNTCINVVDILNAISVPTLIMQRNSIELNIEEGQFISDRIKGSEFIKLDGADYFFWIGNSKGVYNHIRAFIDKKASKKPHKLGLEIILFGEIIKTEKSYFKLLQIKQYLEDQNGASIIDFNNSHFTISFKSSRKAVNCAITLQNVLKESNSASKIGIYVKNGDLFANTGLNKQDKDIKDALFSKISPNQILVTQTIKHILTGGHFNFLANGTIFDPYSQKTSTIFSVEQITSNQKPITLFSHDTFLEDVLKIIETHIDDSSFSVEVLCNKLRISDRQLQRKIKEMTKKTPNQLINSIRLNRAKETLLLSNYTISEIAFQFGFSSPSYFTKCFKKEFEVGPNILKKKLAITNTLL